MDAHRKLSAWRKAHELSVRVHRGTQTTATQHSDLVTHLRRSATSLPLHIIHGAEHPTPLGFLAGLERAIDTVRELRYLLLLALELEVVDHGEQTRLSARAEQIERMLVSLQRVVEERGSRQRGKRRGRSISSKRQEGDRT